VLFYTDGVTEALDVSGNFYGEPRLLEQAATLSGHTAAEACTALLKSVRAHAGDFPQSDDIAVLALNRKK
jgi:sigma-B regulation protein RsbU (phosphoserine phosphatase)